MHPPCLFEWDQRIHALSVTEPPLMENFSGRSSSALSDSAFTFSNGMRLGVAHPDPAQSRHPGDNLTRRAYETLNIRSSWSDRLSSRRDVSGAQEFARI